MKTLLAMLVAILLMVVGALAIIKMKGEPGDLSVHEQPDTGWVRESPQTKGEPAIPVYEPERFWGYEVSPTCEKWISPDGMRKSIKTKNGWVVMSLASCEVYAWPH